MTGQATKTDQPSGRPAGRRTRRQLLAGGTGALAAVLTAEALARPAPAAAANGGSVVLGAANTETLATSITNTNSGTDALDCTATGSGTAVFGSCDGGIAIDGHGGTGGIGVAGGSTGFLGVWGFSDTGVGVKGLCTSGTGTGVLGDCAAGAGVSGTSSSGDAVSGTSSTGHAFFGLAGGPVAAVVGKNTGSGVGVRGECAAGLGVLAIGGVVALEVHGPAVFTRSGVLTVGAGKSSATQTGVPLNSASLVLATMQQDRAGVVIRSAVPNVAGSSFTVHLSKAVSAKTRVAWFVVN